ncbi:MAG: FIST N-terminal domain-containing protein [Deltaproteobacteria bacterium]
MQCFAASFFSLEPDSSDAGSLAAESLQRQFGAERLKAVIVYATMNHDHAELLEALRAKLPKDVLLLGSSVQGVVGNDELAEEGMVTGAIGLGGEALHCVAALEREIQIQPFEKGCVLAKKLKDDLGVEPTLVVLYYDPLSGVDVETLIAGMRTQLACELVGGGSGQPWGRPLETAQFWGTEVLSHGVLAVALSGPFAVEIGICHGTAPTGISSVVTKAEGNQVLEIDGRPAVEIWREVTGCSASDLLHQSHFATWAVGVERCSRVQGPDGVQELTGRVIRGAFGFNTETGAMILQAAVPEGTKIMLHHRTVEDVLNGTTLMGADLAQRLHDRRPWAVLGFECAARTFPFLGPNKTREEHQGLRQVVAPAAPWLGMMAWGEIAPCVGQTAFHNYTYPLVVLVDAPPDR